ncbi:LytR C-terminal domain-containing protein [Phycicoccus flavus]|uniref:LytR C-terminal domain-containing protein n=1 Tax=Phycicoccus flavus TaxID=2502783 RepID=A0A8T6R0Q1_9MICO|nr:LytR C-terminal domain-containing protein [Phycicoccus flavus]NHA67868.1 LytR C-terminal domain-containing protein [Phycicoccus flavus]
MTDYTTESPLSLERRQRRRRAVITIGTLVLGLFFAFWYALSYYEADESRAAPRTPTPTCSPYDPKVRTPADITVNVYNATNRSGLASRTATALEKRGYTVKKVANDPSSRKAPKVAELRYGKKGRAGALTMLDGDLPKGTRGHVLSSRTSRTVDVVLGAGFDGLPPKAQSTGLPMCPKPSASPSS